MWKAKNIVIVGAGAGGKLVINEIRENPLLKKYNVVGFVDDDPSKQGVTFGGKKVLGMIKDLPKIIEKYEISEVLISIPSAEGDKIRSIIRHCSSKNVEYKILPGAYDILTGKARIAPIREIRVDDILKRKPKIMDLSAIILYISGRKVMVTGGAGSIGGELSKQICMLNPLEISILDYEETNLYEIDRKLRKEFPDVTINPILCDIKDKIKVDKIFSEIRPEVVFHAAAYKHVPLMESFPEEAIKTNVFGTKNLIDSSVSVGVDRFILISTDKAVNPTSVMGASKRIAEMMIQKKGNSETRFIIVRFGNVWGSRGSVIPLFREQIEKGGPVTITHPEMTRFFMTIEEAVQLVIQAGCIGEGGDLFVLDMGEPVKIMELAEDMVRLYGLEPYKDIEIEVTDIRPGEKLYEELFTPDEKNMATKEGKLFRTKPQDFNDNYFHELLEELDLFSRRADRKKIISTIKKLIPTYQPINTNMKV